MKTRLAAAVLSAVVTFAGMGSASDALATEDVADDGDRGHFEQRVGARRGGHAVLVLASQLCGRRIDDAWIVDAHEAGGGVAAAFRTAAPQMAEIDLAADGVAGRSMVGMFGASLLADALDHCRNTGVLKVVITSDGWNAMAVRSVAAERGFQFSRSHMIEGRHLLEFYTDLYWRAPSPM